MADSPWMGQRANYVIVGEPHLYSSRHAAISLLEDFAAGPDEALAFVRAQDRTDHWWDDIWCEGATVIDPGHRLLLLFTWHHEGAADRARKMASVRAAWPGWEVRWAYSGVEDVVAYLGLDRKIVRTERDSVTELHPALAEFPEDANFVLTIRHGDGTLRGYSLYHEFGEPLWAGPRVLELAAERFPVPGRNVEPHDDYGPDFGMHLDVARREMGWWTVATIKGAVDDVAACWPGWRVEFWEDRHEEHTGRCTGFAMFPFARQ